jgi:DNA-3-methyladenine glycosylase II
VSDAFSLHDAVEEFVALDRRFEDVRKRFGDPNLVREATRGRQIPQDQVETSIFATLVRTVVSQQLSGTIADRLYERIELLCEGVVTPTRVLCAGSDALVALGLSRAKVRAISELAQKLESPESALSGLEEQSDEEVMATILQLRGFGPWSAHMFLIFHLGRLDIWPSGDLGVRKGLSRLLEAQELLGVKETDAYGEQWRPYRTIAAWYLWRLADSG